MRDLSLVEAEYFAASFFAAFDHHELGSCADGVPLAQTFGAVGGGGVLEARPSIKDVWASLRLRLRKTRDNILAVAEANPAVMVVTASAGSLSYRQLCATIRRCVATRPAP